VKVNIINVVDVNNRNVLFSKGEIDRDDLGPKITEYREQPCTFRFSFRLDELPERCLHRPKASWQWQAKIDRYALGSIATQRRF
jgi:hypothetical protein